VATRDFPNRGGTGIFVYTADRPSLFANIATEIGRQALDIVDARILTTADGFALDTFIVLDAQGEPISEPEQRRVIRRAIKKSLSKPQAEQRPFTRRQDRQSRAFQLPAEISFEPGPSDDTRQMEITASNQPGLVATIASILAAHQISILHARINTYGERVQDQFIVTLPAINDAATEALLDKLQTELLTALNPDSDLPDTPVTREHLSG
ncbi:MAG: ACT domain-containing protein, partial [Gammaproteobacteria bacterium]